MVAMTIGLIVIGAAISLFRNTLSHQRSVTHNALLQEESFFVSHVLRQQIAQIGYRPINVLKVEGRDLPIEDLSTAFPAVPNSWEEGQTIKLEENSLSYRYYGSSNGSAAADSSVFDCFGNPVANGVVQINVISLTDNQLVCGTGGTVTAVIAGAQESIVIEQFVFELGVDDDDDAEIDRNIDAALATSADFINAKQITVRLLLTTTNNTAADITPYTFNGEEFTPTDRKLRTETEVSMALRN